MTKKVSNSQLNSHFWAHIIYTVLYDTDVAVDSQTKSVQNHNSIYKLYDKIIVHLFFGIIIVIIIIIYRKKQVFIAK